MGIELNQPRQASQGSVEHEILINQYFVAADLYKHEDGLNWQKLNHLLYLNAALGAIIGFVIERGTQGVVGFAQWELMLVVASVGMLISASFSLTVWLGTNYLQTRKAAVVAVEQRLIAMGGEHVVKPCGDVRNFQSRFQQKSPTRWVLRLIPLSLTVLWLVILIYLFVRYV